MTPNSDMLRLLATEARQLSFDLESIAPSTELPSAKSVRRHFRFAFATQATVALLFALELLLLSTTTLSASLRPLAAIFALTCIAIFIVAVLATIGPLSLLFAKGKVDSARRELDNYELVAEMAALRTQLETYQNVVAIYDSALDTLQDIGTTKERAVISEYRQKAEPLIAQTSG